MKLIAGLGNVGTAYAKTRHNVGFMVVDRIARELDATWKEQSKLEAAVAVTKVGSEQVVLMKPETMMNLSGHAIQKVRQFYKIDAADTWVVFDDVDIPFGKLRLRHGGASGGHQGVSSTIQSIGPEFIRVRIGISLNDRTKEPSEVYVLKPFAPHESPFVPTVVEAAATVVREHLDDPTPPETTFGLLPDISV